MSDKDETDGMRYVPAFTIGGEATVAQRQRNAALYRALRDGDGTGDFKSSGLAGFVYDLPIERLSIGPGGQSFSFRMQKTDECFTRLLHVIADHFPSKCDADDRVLELEKRVAELALTVAEASADAPPSLRAAAVSALKARVSDLERTRAVDAARIAVLEADILELSTGR